MPATTTPTPRFFLTSKVEHFDRPTLRVRVELAYLNEDNEYRSYDGGNAYAGDWNLEYGDLRIEASHDPSLTLNQTYGWRVEYRDVFAVNIARAEAMARTLRKIERGLAKLDAKWGTPDTFAAYVIRVASVLKVTSFGHEQTAEARAMTGERYRWGDAETLKWQIANRVAEFDKQYAPSQ